jgi:hypothetical protein
MLPSASRYSTVTPSTSRRCSARLRITIRSVPFGPRQLAEGIVQRLGGQRRVEPRERVAQALGQDYLPVVVALGRGLAGGDLAAVADLPAGGLEPR